MDRHATRRHAEAAGALILIVVANVVVISATATRPTSIPVPELVGLLGVAAVVIMLAARIIALAWLPRRSATDARPPQGSADDVVYRLEQRVAQVRWEKSIAATVRRHSVPTESATAGDGSFSCSSPLRRASSRLDDALRNLERSFRSPSAPARSSSATTRDEANR